MKKEDIYNGITDIRTDLVESAGQCRKKPFHWRGVAAACLALALIAGGTLAALSLGMGRSEAPGGYTGGGVSEPPTKPASVSGGSPGSSEASGPSGSGTPVAALCKAVFPQAVPYPKDGMYSADWSDYQYEHRLSPDAAGTLDGYLNAAVPALLTGSGNAVCSPVSIFTALAMLCETARGETQEQILELLGVPDTATLRALTNELMTNLYNDDGAEIVRLASSLWLRNDMGDNFYNKETLAALAGDYYASAYAGKPGTEEMDAALQGWLNEQTGGLLTDSVEDVKLKPDTVAALASAVYFSGKWNQGFREENTRRMTFHAPGGDREAAFMNAVFTIDYYPFEDFTGLELAFEMGASMRLILPREGTDPQTLLKSREALDFLLGPSLDWRKGREAQVSLSMPKFDVTSDADLIDTLRSLGVTDAFDPVAADLSGLAGLPGDIYVGTALHSARVKVDEEGCEAAAFTVMMTIPTSSEPPEEKLDLVFDRPFLFSVMEEGVPLFTGLISDP